MALGTVLLLYDGQPTADALLDLAHALVGSKGRVIPVNMAWSPGALPPGAAFAWIQTGRCVAAARAQEVAEHRRFTVQPGLFHAMRRAQAIAEIARICEVDAILVPLCGWNHPWRRMCTLRTARALMQTASRPVLMSTWRRPQHRPCFPPGVRHEPALAPRPSSATQGQQRCAGSDNGSREVPRQTRADDPVAGRVVPYFHPRMGWSAWRM